MICSTLCIYIALGSSLHCNRSLRFFRRVCFFAAFRGEEKGCLWWGDFTFVNLTLMANFLVELDTYVKEITCKYLLDSIYVLLAKRKSSGRLVEDIG